MATFSSALKLKLQSYGLRENIFPVLSLSLSLILSKGFPLDFNVLDVKQSSSLRSYSSLFEGRQLEIPSKDLLNLPI